jgi:hypothetical protein
LKNRRVLIQKMPEYQGPSIFLCGRSLGQLCHVQPALRVRGMTVHIDQALPAVTCSFLKFDSAERRTGVSTDGMWQSAVPVNANCACAQAGADAVCFGATS